MELAGLASVVPVGDSHQRFYVLNLLPYLRQFTSVSQMLVQTDYLILFFSVLCCLIFDASRRCKIRWLFNFGQLHCFLLCVGLLSMSQSSWGVTLAHPPCTSKKACICMPEILFLMSYLLALEDVIRISFFKIFMGHMHISDFTNHNSNVVSYISLPWVS